MDFAATYNDFQRITAELEPAAILGFGNGGGPWELEMNFPAYFSSWFQSGQIPSSIGVSVQYAIPESLKRNIVRHSSLPVEEILYSVNQTPQSSIHAWLDSNGNAGDFLCGFLGYLIAWYHEEHADPEATDFNQSGGFIHVNGDTSGAVLAMEATIDSVIRSLR